MRITLTLDDDVAADLKALARERDQPFKQVVNETLRKGLQTPTEHGKPFVQTTSDLGIRPEFEGISMNRLADMLEDEAILRKMSQGR